MPETLWSWMLSRLEQTEGLGPESPMPEDRFGALGLFQRHTESAEWSPGRLFWLTPGGFVYGGEVPSPPSKQVFLDVITRVHTETGAALIVRSPLMTRAWWLDDNNFDFVDLYVLELADHTGQFPFARGK